MLKIVLFLFFAVPFVRLALALFWPRSLEAFESRRAQAVIERMFGSARREERVESIGSRLAQAAGLDARFHVLRGPLVNAVTLPDGQVFVWEGLLTRTRQDDDMLAGVLAHELAHLHHRHFLEQVKLVALLHALFGAWARSWPRLLIRNTVKRLVFTGYNHGREHQADATAVDILVRADFDPVGLLRVFHALQEGAPPVGMTGTHPNTSDRIERVAEVLRARGGSHADHAPRTVLDFPGSKEPS